MQPMIGGTPAATRRTSGLNARLARLARLHRATSPFVAVPAAEASDAQWVTPTLVGEVEFANWTADRVLRHARWRGLRPDKTPAEVVVEE